MHARCQGRFGYVYRHVHAPVDMRCLMCGTALSSASTHTSTRESRARAHSPGAHASTRKHTQAHARLLRRKRSPVLLRPNPARTLRFRFLFLRRSMRLNRTIFAESKCCAAFDDKFTYACLLTASSHAPDVEAASYKVHVLCSECACPAAGCGLRRRGAADAADSQGRRATILEGRRYAATLRRIGVLHRSMALGYVLSGGGMGG
eukprot:6195112-Pleurochrysis_carterae.AAC.1